MFCEAPIPLDVALTGGEVSVPTLGRMAKLKISPGTETGRVFRLRGKGMPLGDLVAAICMPVFSEIPKIFPAFKKALEGILDACNESNYPEVGQFQRKARSLYPLCRNGRRRENHG